MDSLLPSCPGVRDSTPVNWTEIESLPAVTSEDLALVEAEIARHLGGEGGRCGWLRSREYMRLRLSALYYPHLCVSEPLHVYCQALRVSLLNGAVTLCRRDLSEGCYLATLEEYLALDAVEPEPPCVGPRRRRAPPGLGKRARDDQY